MLPPGEARELAARYAPWARRIAISLVVIYDVGHLRDDLVGTALLTLSRVAESFDPSRGWRFETFAYKRIAGEVLDEIGKELRHLTFLRAPMLDASLRSPGDGSDTGEVNPEESIEASLAKIDAILADAMSAAVFGCMGEDRRSNGEARLIEHQADARLRGALGLLSPEERRLVELRYFEGLAWTQVALALDLPERTAKDRDHKIRRHLRACLDERD